MLVLQKIPASLLKLKLSRKQIQQFQLKLIIGLVFMSP